MGGRGSSVSSFDGMVLLLPYHIPEERTEFVTDCPYDDDYDSGVKVTINFVKVKQMDDCLVFFNLLLKRIMHKINYFSCSSTLEVHQEMGDTLGTLMNSALDAYYKERAKYPDKIIVFRDGGSTGSLDQIANTEMKSMHKVLAERDQPISLSFVVVRKRIPQRFFLEQGNTFKNPEPGTIVDSTVTRRDQYDFFIVSQKVSEGSVNPTHFVVLKPDDPIEPDMMQRIAYVTCYMYYNWSGTVRVPAMVQLRQLLKLPYAHKLAVLIQKHVKTTPAASIAHTLYYL